MTSDAAQRWWADCGRHLLPLAAEALAQLAFDAGRRSLAHEFRQQLELELLELHREIEAKRAGG